MNKNLMQTRGGPATDAVNEAGGKAYARAPKEALAQMAVTGCLNSTFYVKDEDQLTGVLELASKCEPEFVAKVAIYSREHGRMKDMPVLLTAHLLARGYDGIGALFPRTINTTKQLSNFVRVIRSGAVGRKSLGSRGVKLVQRWLEAQRTEDLWRFSIGVADPSMADILRLAHPKPSSDARRALYGYLSGKNPKDKPVDQAMLPSAVRDYEALKRGEVTLAQVEGHIPFQALTSMDLDQDGWKRIARRASWQQARQLLNTFGRNGLWTDKAIVAELAAKLRVPDATAMPYQLLATYTHVTDCPRPIVDALHDAVEQSVANCPALPENTHVFVDVSGSMSNPITGHRPGATTKIRCVDVAALFATTILRRQPAAHVVAFDTALHPSRLEPRDTILTNAKRLAALGGGGTNCSLPMIDLALQTTPVDLVIYVSDNESWADSQFGRGTATAQAWEHVKTRCPRAKLVCIDLTPTSTTQARTGGDTINIGGFNDAVFRLIADFAGEWGADAWMKRIDSIAL